MKNISEGVRSQGMYNDSRMSLVANIFVKTYKREVQ